MNDIESATRFAKKYTEDLLSFFGLNTEVAATNDSEVILLEVPSTGLNGFLIGSNADTLRAFQSIVIAALKSKDYTFQRVNLDIAGYKQMRQDKLRTQATGWVEKVKQTGTDMPLQPMNAADRRVIHQLADESGVGTESVGEGKDRHIVLKAKP